MKSRSPAPGAKKGALGGRRTELQDLPPLDSLPDGDKTHFIGGWCAEGGFAPTVTRIANESRPPARDAAAEEPMIRLAKDLEEGRFAAALQPPPNAPDALVTEFTRVNVVVLPSVGPALTAADPSSSSATSAAVAEVTHGMFISGLLPHTLSAASADFTARHPTAPALGADGEEEGEGNAEEGEGNADSEEAAPTARPPRYVVTRRNEDDEEGDDDDGEGEPLDEDGNPIERITPEEAARRVAGLKARGSAVTAADVASYLTEVDGAMAITDAAKALDPQSLRDTRFSGAPAPAGGTGYANPKRPTLYRRGLTVVDPSDLVTIRGAVTFRGIRPEVTVVPEEVTAARVASSLGVASVNAVDRNGKPRRKTDEEKQKEADAAAQLEQESKDAALAEEARLNAFAMPERWPTVYVSSLAFAGNVTIEGAHLRFYRCHFSGTGFADCIREADPKAAFSAMVSIGQYCRVEFADCTFQQPQHTAVYAYPTAELLLQDCYLSQRAIPTTIEAALSLAVLPPRASPLPSPGEGSVGLHADCARVAIVRSHFEGFGSAVILRGAFNVVGRMLINGEEDEPSPASPQGDGGSSFGVGAEANDDGHLPIRLRPALSTITNSVFLNNSCASVTLIDARRTAVTKCYLSDEASGGYYSVQATGDRCTPQIVRCTINGRVLIGKGSRPFLHKNTGKTQIVDKNQTEASYMSPKY